MMFTTALEIFVHNLELILNHNLFPLRLSHNAGGAECQIRSEKSNNSSLLSVETFQKSRTFTSLIS